MQEVRATQEAKAGKRSLYLINEQILLCEYSSTFSPTVGALGDEA
jgi:hypothetical protein